MPKIVLLLGSAGSGKGTLAQRIVEQHPTDTFHLSTGDVCREQVARKTELGKRFAAYMTKGSFVPDHLIIEMVKDRLTSPEIASKKTVLLDGFPRTVNQARQLAQSFDIDRVVVLQASDDLCVQRILERRIDPVTQHVYNLKTAKPPSGEVESRLVRRDMDVEESVIRKRLVSFHSSLAPILSVFKGKIFAVNSAQELQNVVDAMFDILSMPLNVEASPQSEAEVKAEQEKRRKEKAAAAAATDAAQSSKPTVIVKDRKGDCVVCRDAPADYLLIPCGHQVGCENCLNTLIAHGYGCPICRSKPQSIIRVFQSGYVDDEPTTTDGQQQKGGDDDDQQKQQEQEEEGQMTADEILGNSWAQTSNNRAPAAASGGGDAAVSEGDISLSVALCEPHNEHNKTNRVAVIVNVPDVMPSVAVDICCVIDISGSVGMEAQFQDPNNDQRMVGANMTLLDLTKHAVRTVINTLGENDRMSITAFDDDAFEALPLTLMTAEGKANAVAALDDLAPRNATNIWYGLMTGLDSMRESSDAAGAAGHLPRRKQVFLLTDGRPNDSPPDGETAELRKYKEKHSNFHASMNFFGFGYKLDSKLMLDLAHEGGGTFSFVPDAKILGTNFVNAVANARTCLCPHTKIHLAAKNGATFSADDASSAAPLVDSTIPCKQAPWGPVAKLGPLHAGTTRDVVINIANYDKISRDDFLDITLEYLDATTGDIKKIKATGSTKSAPTQEAIAANARATACATLAKIIDLCDHRHSQEAHQALRVLVGQVTALEALTHNPKIKSLLDDVNGRIAKSISTVERWNRWGAHYLRALYRSHSLQMRTNFMDASLQVYGGKNFEKLVDEGGKIFITLPMKSSMTSPGDRRHRQGGAAAAGHQHQQGNTRHQQQQQRHQLAPAPRPPTPVDNSEFFGGAGGGCFAGCCTVEVASLSHANGGVGDEAPKNKNVRDVRRGDKLRMADGTFAMVDVVVEMRSARSDLVKFRDTGLTITPNHPMFVQGRGWCRPASCALPQEKNHKSLSVFNFLFRGERPTCGLLVNKSEVVTWHHNIPEVQHTFYTSSKIVQKLQSLDGFDEGFVCVNSSSVKNL